MTQQPQRIPTISAFHQLRGLPKPEHPLISVVDYSAIQHPPGTTDRWVFDFYSISVKRTTNAKIRYGQQSYDFDEGVMFFMAPGQVFSITVGTDPAPQHTGWMLLIHPDFLWNSTLAKTIRQYDFFDYSVHEALFLSEKEEATLGAIIKQVKDEYHSNIDAYSQQIILSQVETLLHYAERFYQRQFITRKISNHQVLDRLEQWLSDYFTSDALLLQGLPTVQAVAEAMHMSPNYLGGLLKSLTGQTTQQHIHEKLVALAKEKLSGSDLSVSEIAYELGFEHPQSFSKFFKDKTRLSPLAFRQTFQ